MLIIIGFLLCNRVDSAWRNVVRADGKNRKHAADDEKNIDSNTTPQYIIMLSEVL